MFDKAAWQKEWCNKNSEKAKQIEQQWYQRNKEKVCEAHKQYRQTEKGKLASRKTSEKYYQTEKGKTAYKKANAKYKRTEKGKFAERKYRKSKKGKLAHLKINAKRKRNLGWIPLYENPLGESEIVDWHHINNAYVVALPRDLHQVYGGKQHREKTITIIKQIYGG